MFEYNLGMKVPVTFKQLKEMKLSAILTATCTVIPKFCVKSCALIIREQASKSRACRHKLEMEMLHVQL